MKDRTTDRAALDDAVRCHLMSDVPYGVLISGGLDSSIIAALASRHAAMRVEDNEKSPAWWPRRHSFAVGLTGSPDLVAAREVAAHLGTVHHEVVYTIQEGLDAVPVVIRHLETYDVTTIRAATPMYLMARRIRAMGIKMVLFGEGADGIFGGYLYFHKAPGDKMCGGGVIEKCVLRECFADLLPQRIARRQKEQFSDGVGYGWIDALKTTAQHVISDEVFAERAVSFPINTPVSKEAYYYRAVFEQHFGGTGSVLRTVPYGKSVACSTEAAPARDVSLRLRDDPSGRAVAVHEDAYDGGKQPG